MKQGSSTLRWSLDRLLRLAAAATALCSMPAMIASLFIFKPATTPGLVAALVSMMVGFIVAILLVLASFSFWPDKSTKRKAPALILITTIYVTAACGLSLAGAGAIAIAYAKSQGFHIPARANTALVRHAS